MKQVVEKPLLTEKTLLRASGGWYTFRVKPFSTKAQIARDIAALYGVKVTDVRSARVHGKRRRVGRKQTMVATSDWKKAMVRLAEGQKIDAFEVMHEGEKK